MQNNILVFKTVTLLMLLGCAFNIQSTYAVNCGDFVVADVVLTENLECTTGTAAVHVASNNVTIDLNGFILSGTNALAGINVFGYDNVVVRNGSIKGFWAGINGSHSDKLNVSKVTFYEVDSGVIIHAGGSARIVDNDFIKLSGRGVVINVTDELATANRNLISRNEFYRVRVGIYVCGAQADYNVISDNLIWKSTDYGIHLNHSDRNRIYRNRILETVDGSALRLNNSSYNVVNDNSIREGGHNGISIYGYAGGACLSSEANRSVKNRFSQNQLSGFGTAINMGLGVGPTGNVEGNGVLENGINDNGVGIVFQSDTRNNYARDNDFSGTITPISDQGVNNHY